MQFRRLLALMSLIFSLVLSSTIPAPAQKSSKQPKRAKLTNSKQLKGKESATSSPLRITPHVTNCPNKTPISPGQTINGTLSNSDCGLGDGSFFDEYTFTANAGQQLFVTMSSATFDTYLFLLDPSNNDTQDDDGGGGPNGTDSRIPTNSGFYTAPATGTYAILANSFDPGITGNYSVTLTFGVGTSCPPAATPITNGQTINGTFIAGDCSLQDGSRFDRYSFSASAGQQVAITMTGTSPVDPYLFLIAPDGDFIGEDDNGGGGTTARIPPVAATFGSLPQTGTYIIWANTALADQFGNYSLTLNFSGSNCPSTAISFGQTINGTLAAGDCRLPFDASLFDAYTFSGTGGQQITITQTSAAFDAFLFLLDPVGTAIAADDDTAGGTNARIVFTLPSTGTYTILANSIDASMSGDYAVTLSSGAAASSIQLTSSTYAFGEGAGAVNIGISRTGDTSLPATVNYASSDPSGLNECSSITGNASARCDYPTSVGTARFAAGENSKTISIPLVDDAYAEGNENFTFTLSNASGATLGAPNTATVTIQDNEATNGPNPIFTTNFFVRQQYVDFLGREPDPAGFAGWVATLNGCAAGDTACDRIQVSSGFFRSPEFQDRGFFIYRFYATSFGVKPSYAEFIPDFAKVSGFLTDQELEAAKVNFIAEFMTRTAFTTKYNGLSDAQYVDTLLSSAGITHPARDFWVAALGNGTRTRAQVLREIAESGEVSMKFFNQAFVVMQYFGYLRRDPDASWLTWLAILNANPSDYRSMISGFMNSGEYNVRFGTFP